MVVDVTIETLGAQGDGITADGIFVPGALPGERVRIAPAGHRAQLVDVIQPATDRMDPTCRHFGTCGGCSLQHASDGLLAGWKHSLIHRALSARGIEGVEILPTLTVPAHSRRRAVFTGRRTKKTTLVGFHGPASDDIVDIEDCPVATPAINAALPALHALVETGASRKGALRMTVTEAPIGLDVSVEGGKPVEGPMYGQLVAIAATSDLARLSWDGEPVVTRRPPVHRMGRAQILPPPGGFLQASLEAEHALVAAMRRAVGSAKQVADLYAGCGTFSIPLAEGAEVWAVESDAEALAALEAGWRQADGLKSIRTEVRDLNHRPILPREFGKIDALVFDPPRAGARAQCEHLAQCDIARIGAVSCNPATFARDARILIDGGYRLVWIQPVDQFRWSPHVELAAEFIRLS